ncbi:hypothetical protein IAT40_000521 [Kwoniella sp. CBS 6097]
MPAATATLGVFIPVIPALFSTDLGDLLKYAHDRPSLQWAIALALARPLPAVRKAISMSDTMEELGYEKREDPSRISKAFRALAASNRTANRHLADLIHQEERLKSYKRTITATLVPMVVAVFIGLGLTAFLATWLGWSDESTGERVAKIGFLALLSLALQVITGCFSVWDCRTRDITGTRDIHSYLKGCRSSLKHWEIFREKFKQVDPEDKILDDIIYPPARLVNEVNLSSFLGLDTPVEVGGATFRSRVKVKKIDDSRKSQDEWPDKRGQPVPLAPLFDEILDKGKVKEDYWKHQPKYLLRTSDDDELRKVLSTRQTLRFDSSFSSVSNWIRWLRLEWGFVVGQSYIWLWITQLPTRAILWIGLVQIGVAGVSSGLVFRHIMGDSNRDDRLLATIRIHDVVVPSYVYDLGDVFTVKVWNALVVLCEKLDEIVTMEGADGLRDKWKADDPADGQASGQGGNLSTGNAGAGRVTVTETEKQTLIKLFTYSRAEQVFLEKLITWIGQKDLELQVN